MLFCFIGSIHPFCGGFGSKFLENLAQFTDYDFVGEGIEYLTIWILIMAVYSFVSGRMYRKEYDDAERRVKVYQKELKDLEKFAKGK